MSLLRIAEEVMSVTAGATDVSVFQDFPENFLWCGTKTETSEQIVDAVPVGIARTVAKHICQQLIRQ